MGNAGGRAADEESPLVGGRRAAGGGTGGSPLSSARAAWFSEAGAGGGPGQQHAQSYGAFVKGAGVGGGNHHVGSLGTASSARGPGSSSSRSAEGSRRGLQALREHWPVLIEFLASFTLATVAFTSRAHPWALGLVLAGLAHAASTGTYYLQANPALTLAQVLRGHVALARAAMYWAAQLLGLVLATLAHSLTGPPTTPTLLGALTPLTSCKAQHFGPALLLLALFSSAWTYVALSAWDSMALALEASCTFYGLAHGAAFAAAAASVQARGVGAALLNPWVGLLALVDTAARGGAGAGGGGGGSGVSCGVLYVVGPVLGAGVGAVLSWLTSLNGSEKEAFLRAISPTAPLLVETVGVVYLVATLGAPSQGFTTGAMALALTLCAWRRSGAQFNPGVTLAIFLLKRQMFRWASLLFYILAHLAGALIGGCILILLPLARGGDGYAPVGVLQEEVHLDARGAISLLVLSTVFLAAFVANTDAEYDEGFLHPALMVGVTFTGLLAAGGGSGAGSTVMGTGLFNPAVTLVLWSISRASTGVVLLGTLIQLAASALAFGFFWLKNQLDV